MKAVFLMERQNLEIRDIPVPEYKASGAQTAFGMVLQGIKKGGHVSFVGKSNALVPMNLNLILKKEALITGIYRYVNSMKIIIES